MSNLLDRAIREINSFSAIPKRRSEGEKHDFPISTALVRVNRPNFCPATAPLRPCSGHTMMACCIQIKRGVVDEFQAESDTIQTPAQVGYPIAGAIRSA
jgi:hypothetical protein